MPIQNMMNQCDALREEFRKSGFDLERFMGEKMYEQIEDDIDRVEFLLELLAEYSKGPIADLMPDIQNGYLEFFNTPMPETEVLHRLYDCKTDEEIWQLVAKGIGNVTELYHWYMGECPKPDFREWSGIPCYCQKDEAKAERMLQYLLKESTGAKESVRKEAEGLMNNNN